MKNKSLIKEVKHFQKIAGILKESIEMEDYHPDDPAGWDSAAARGEDDYEGEEEDDEWANVTNTIEGWIDYLYSGANPKQKAKLANIYRHQMENEEAEDARDFFIDLIDSGDPDAIIDLKDLNQYSGY
jgi:hypothetical protein